MNRALRQAYLKAMGLTAWQLRSTSTPTVEQGDGDERLEQSELERYTADTSGDAYRPPQPEPAVLKMTDPLLQPRDDDDIVHDDEVEAEPKASCDLPGRQDVSKRPEVLASQAEPIPLWFKAIESCQRCPARRERYQPLVAKGNYQADIFIITTAPSALDDRQGDYLSGAEGSLFEAMCRVIGLENRYYLTALVKCYSLQDYTIAQDDINHCADFLTQQIQYVEPRLLLLWGPKVAQTLLQSTQSFRQLRQQAHQLSMAGKKYPVRVSYSPAYLLRNPLDKKQALQDLLQIKAYLR